MYEEVNPPVCRDGSLLQRGLIERRREPLDIGHVLFAVIAVGGATYLLWKLL